MKAKNNILYMINGSLKKSNKKSNISEDNWKQNTMMQNLWDTVKPDLRGKFTVIQAHFRKQEKSHITT